MSWGANQCRLVQVSNFSNPSTLEGVSMASLLLGMLGNGLMVPRALFTGDKIWFIGVGWGPLTGWVQLLSLYVAYGVTGYVLAVFVPHGQLSWQCVGQRLPDACMYLHGQLPQQVISQEKVIVSSVSQPIMAMMPTLCIIVSISNLVGSML